MIIFDLDGTLADCEHRRHFITKPNDVKCIYSDSIPHGNGCILTGHYEYSNGNKWIPDYKSFYEACDQDKPIDPTIIVLVHLLLQFPENIQIWSGRCESVRSKTENWLDNHLPLHLVVDIHKDKDYSKILKMRPIGDYTPDDQLKERWLDEYVTKQLFRNTKHEEDSIIYKPIQFVFDSDPKSISMWHRRGVFVFNCCQHNERF